MSKVFNTSIQDSQGTHIDPMTISQFDLDAYADYENSLLESNKEFLNSKHGLLVYRRVRANGVFYDKCRDYKESLELQLGALKKSMEYKADIANFLEPWYGIGYIAASFGNHYKWQEGQAPSVEPAFTCAEDLLNADIKPIADTEIGRHILEMEEYFLDQTKGKLPMSFCDIQSPLNMLSYLIPITDLFMEIYDDPDSVMKAAELVSDLLIEFLKKQQSLIGDCLARPGHGFASSRVFGGAGMSDDNSIMLQPDDYVQLFQPSDEKIGAAFGGTVYHSCGTWENKINMVKNFAHLTTVDGAFSIETDPSPNNPEVFAKAFEHTGVVVNARAVGDCNDSFEVFKKLWTPGQKMIAVTYCQNPDEQEKLYHMLHALTTQTI